MSRDSFDEDINPFDDDSMDETENSNTVISVSPPFESLCLFTPYRKPILISLSNKNDPNPVRDANMLLAYIANHLDEKTLLVFKTQFTIQFINPFLLNQFKVEEEMMFENDDTALVEETIKSIKTKRSKKIKEEKNED